MNRPISNLIEYKSEFVLIDTHTVESKIIKLYTSIFIKISPYYFFFIHVWINILNHTFFCDTYILYALHIQNQKVHPWIIFLIGEKILKLNVWFGSFLYLMLCTGAQGHFSKVYVLCKVLFKLTNILLISTVYKS